MESGSKLLSARHGAGEVGGIPAESMFHNCENICKRGEKTLTFGSLRFNYAAEGEMPLLTQQQRDHFVEHGYVVLPGLIPQERVELAQRAINHSLGEGVPREKITQFRSQSFCPELQRSELLLGTVHDPEVWSCLSSLFAPEGVPLPASVQVALRFPTAPGTLRREPVPHVDGFPAPNNGVAEGTISSFTGLAGVLLSDVPNQDAGNFTVWPGTHRSFAAYYRQRGPEEILREVQEGIIRVGVPPVPLPSPVQITGRAGDVVLAHYLLAHGVASNTAPHTRYALFFRLCHTRHTEQRWQAMGDPWLEWEREGCQAALA